MCLPVCILRQPVKVLCWTLTCGVLAGPVLSASHIPVKRRQEIFSLSPSSTPELVGIRSYYLLSNRLMAMLFLHDKQGMKGVKLYLYRRNRRWRAGLILFYTQLFLHLYMVAWPLEMSNKTADMNLIGISDTASSCGILISLIIAISRNRLAAGQDNRHSLYNRVY